MRYCVSLKSLRGTNVIRFSEETRRKIKDSQWWNKDIEGLKKNFQEFLQPVGQERKDEIQTS